MPEVTTFPVAMAPEAAQDAMNKLARTATSVLDQYLRGRHNPTRVQCLMLCDALDAAVPFLTPEAPGLAPVSNGYVQEMRNIVENGPGWSPKG